MADIGRNEPCPCGSGRKYKRCCLLKEESNPASDLQRLHDMDERLLRDVGRWAARRFPAEYDAAFDEFPWDVEEDHIHLQLFVPWSCCHYRIEGRPAIDWYLEERGRYLAATEREWLEAQQRSWMTVWEVTAVHPGEGIVEVVDLLSKEKRVVREISGSKVLAVRDAVLARVVDFNGTSVFAGTCPRPLPPREADHIVSYIRMIARGRSKNVKVEKLRDPEIEAMLLSGWSTSVKAMDERPLPTLQNTDGEDLILTTDHFTPTSADAIAIIEQRLKDEPDVESGDSDGDYTFVRAGNRMHKSWDNTILGRLMIDKGALRIESNSRERADELRARFERLCSGLVVHRIREHADPMASPNMKRPAEKSELLDPAQSPEVAEALREFKRQHYVDWLDQELPALDGHTPRAAATMPELRRDVDLLLKEIERSESRLPEEQRFDVKQLRGELGLEEPSAPKRKAGKARSKR